MNDNAGHARDMHGRRRMAVWLVLSILAALLAYVGFRAYLNPELLFHFSNAFYC